MSTTSEVQTADGVASFTDPEPPQVVLAGLYERHASRILAFCRRRLRTPQEAEDALQNTFVAALQALQRGTVPVSETAWLYKIAENACNAIYRAGARRDDRELTDPDKLARYAGTDRGGDALVGLDVALDSISENQRKAFVLRELRGFSYAEIAVGLGVSVASVETLIYRARRGIARALEDGSGARRRVRAAIDLGSFAAGLKGWIVGLSAVKVAAATAVVVAATVPAHELLTHGPEQPARAPAVSSSDDPAKLPSGSGHQSPAAEPVLLRGPALRRPRASASMPGSAIAGRHAPPVEHEAPAAATTDALPQPPGPPPQPASEVPAPQAPGPAPPPPPPATAPLPPPPPTATAPLPTLPDLPPSPVELPTVPQPVLPPPPLPETPSLPSVPGLPDVGETLSEVLPLP